MYFFNVNQPTSSRVVEVSIPATGRATYCLPRVAHHGLLATDYLSQTTHYSLRTTCRGLLATDYLPRTTTYHARCHSADFLLLTTYCLLPTTYYLLPTTYYLLPTTYYLLPTTYYLLPTTYYLLLTTYYLLLTTYYLLATTYYLLPTTYYLLPTTYYLLLTTYYLLLTTYYLLLTTYYLLRITYYLLLTTYYLLLTTCYLPQTSYGHDARCILYRAPVWASMAEACILTVPLASLACRSCIDGVLRAWGGDLGTLYLPGSDPGSDGGSALQVGVGPSPPRENASYSSRCDAVGGGGGVGRTPPPPSGVSLIVSSSSAAAPLSSNTAVTVSLQGDGTGLAVSLRAGDAAEVSSGFDEEREAWLRRWAIFDVKR